MKKENSLKIPLREQENLKELFRMLEQNGMTAEKKQVLQMADYIDDMETKMEMVLKDLKEMPATGGSPRLVWIRGSGVCSPCAEILFRWKYIRRADRERGDAEIFFVFEWNVVVPEPLSVGSGYIGI